MGGLGLEGDGRALRGVLPVGIAYCGVGWGFRTEGLANGVCGVKFVGGYS